MFKSVLKFGNLIGKHQYLSCNKPFCFLIINYDPRCFTTDSFIYMLIYILLDLIFYILQICVFMKSKITLVILFFFLSLMETFAQSDFRDGLIITLDQDTIHGLVDYQSNVKNYKHCRFKKDGVIKVYSPNQIMGFGYLDDKFFISTILNGVFVEVLVSGEISLYKTNMNFFLRKRKGKVYKLESHRTNVEIDGKILEKQSYRWRGTISYLISDCFSNSNELVKNLKLREKSLTNLIVRYNNCKGSDFTVFKESKLWTKVDFGAAIGIASSSIEIKSKPDIYTHLSKSYNSIDPTVGLIMTLSSPRISEKLALQTEIHYTQSNYSDSKKVLKGVFTEFHETYIDLATISVPVSLRYTLLQGKFSLFMQGGINLNYHIKRDTRLLSTRIQDDIVMIAPEKEAFYISDRQIGYWGGIGILKPFNRFDLSVVARCYKMMDLNLTEALTADHNRFALSLIIYRKGK